MPRSAISSRRYSRESVSSACSSSSASIGDVVALRGIVAPPASAGALGSPGVRSICMSLSGVFGISAAVELS
jgi:hypothetical protein